MYRSPNGIPNLYTGREGAWLQLVHCALLYAWCLISEGDSEEDGVREEEYRADQVDIQTEV